MLISIFIFLIGICIGSFLNVVIYRYNTGLPIVNGRSRCGSCSKTLAWYELIPIFSFLMQKGSCRSCKTRLSAQYPIVELAVGIVFLSLSSMLPLASFLFLYSIVQWSLLTVIFVYDLRHKIIPDLFVFLFAGFALVESFILNPSLAALLAGPAVALPLFLLWLVSKGKWMGFGDVKFALGMGWFLGLSSGFAALVLAFWVGAIISLGILALQRGKVTMKSEIPFAPFLIIGVALAFFRHIGLPDLLNLFNFIS